MTSSSAEKSVALVALGTITVMTAHFFTSMYQELHEVMPAPVEIRWIVDLAMILTFLVVGVYVPVKAYRGNLG